MESGVRKPHETEARAHVDNELNTSVEGIYAAGDLTDGTELKQTITAAAQGAIAALSAYQHVMEVKASR